MLSNVNEVPVEELKREFWQQGVNGNQVDPQRLSGRDEVHFFEPDLQELPKCHTVRLVKRPKDFIQKPVKVNDDYAVYESYQGCYKRVLQPPAGALTWLGLDELLYRQNYKLFLCLKNELEGLLSV